MQNPDIWVIGDLQGCAHSLKQLLAHPTLRQPEAHFVFVGDLVNRGPDSLGVLRQIMALGPRAQTVLGNHDIHLLAVAAGVRTQHKADTLQCVLDAPDASVLIDWLRHQPLAIHLAGHLIVHAGVDPNWSLQTVLGLAKDIEQTVQADNWQEHINNLFGNQPDVWSADLEGMARQRYAINAFTRLRYFNAENRFHHKYKGKPNHPDAQGLTPWFAMPNRQLELPVVFGHWSTLGLHLQPDAVGIDTGCLWGGVLTAIRLNDRHVVQVPNTDGSLHPF